MPFIFSVDAQKTFPGLEPQLDVSCVCRLLSGSEKEPHSEPLALTGESHRVWPQSQGAPAAQMLQDLCQGWADVGLEASRPAHPGCLVPACNTQPGRAPAPQPPPGLLSSSDVSAPLQVKWLPGASDGVCWKGSSRTAGTNGALGRTARRTTSPSAVRTVSVSLLTGSGAWIFLCLESGLLSNSNGENIRGDSARPSVAQEPAADGEHASA